MLPVRETQHRPRMLFEMNAIFAGGHSELKYSFRNSPARAGVIEAVSAVFIRDTGGEKMGVVKIAFFTEGHGGAIRVAFPGLRGQPFFFAHVFCRQVQEEERQE